MNLADFIDTERETILKEWDEFAHTLLPAAGGIAHESLRDHAEEILRATAEG